MQDTTTTTIWLSPTDFVSGDPSLQISYPSVSSPNTTVTCPFCTAPGDLKWISMGLHLPENVRIEDLVICYQLSSENSFISQIRLTEMKTPDKAIVIHDDGTDLQSTTPICYASQVGGKIPSDNTAVTLALRLNFQNTNDKIMLGAVGVKVLSTTQNYCVNVKDFGAVGDGSANDTAAIQAAVDAGTCIVFPSGTYICKEVSIQSNKTIEGLGDATLKHPDGQSGNILASATHTTEGSITTGDRILKVNSSVGFEVGAVCTVLGAAGGHMTQETVILASLGASSTTLEVGTTSNFPGNGVVVVESELIMYTGTTVNSFTGCTRGVFGTIATPHPADTPVRLSKYLVTTIEKIDGTNVVTLEDPASLTVSNASVEVGAVNLAIRHLRFDGNKGANSPFNPFCVRLTETRFFTIEECIIKNADHGGIYVTLSRDGMISNNYLSDNGQPSLQLGANIWVFSNCHNIKMVKNIIGGGSMIGIAIDDRSTGGHYGAGPCSNCILESNIIDGKGEEGLGILVEGSSTNSVTNNHIFNCLTGISLGEAQGVPISEPCTNNLVSLNIISGCSTGISAASSSSNLICNM